MKSLLKILRFTKHLWPYYTLVGGLNIFLALLSQTQPLLVREIVAQLENVGSSALNQNALLIFVLLLFAQDLLDNVVTNFMQYHGDILAGKLKRDLSNRYYEHILSLPQEYFDTELSGKITARLTRSVQQITMFIAMMGNNFGPFILSTVFSLAIVAYYSWPIALLLFSLYPIFIWLTIRSSDKWMKYQADINTNQDIAFGRFQETITQVKAVKSFVREKSELNFFSSKMTRILRLIRPQSKHWHVRDVQRKLVLNVIFGIVYAILIWQASQGILTLAETIMLFQFTILIRVPIFTINFLVENIQKAVADSKDYFEVMETIPAIEDVKNAKKLGVTEGEIKFDSIEFAYDTQPVINGLDFTIQPGSKVALVGESGEGKSTIANLLLRLYQPQKGRICIDNQDIAQVSQRSLRDTIGVVFQEPNLFSGTIAENIAYGRPKASQKDIEKAAKAANAHEFINAFPDGYQTIIGERGLRLSGGQKQRIAIARALLKDAPILILDEATSSLDGKSELLVQEALERLMHNRTTIIIAHRLSTIQNVDQIVTLKKGRVDEIGSPAELAKTQGIYAQLLEVQSARSADERKAALSKFGIVA